jgi:hypothetical protein
LAQRADYTLPDPFGFGFSMNSIPKLLVALSMAGCAAGRANTIEPAPLLTSIELLERVPQIECGGIQGLVRSSRAPYEHLDGVLVRLRNSPVATLTAHGGLFAISTSAVEMVGHSEDIVEVARIGFATQQILAGR